MDIGVRHKLYKHQQQLIETPFKYPNIEYFWLIAGYGSGKTTSDVYLLLSLCKRYFDYPIKIGVLGITITLLKKTLIGDFIRFMISSGIEYTFDKQENVVRVGKVEIFLVALENPDDVYAHNFNISLVDELDELRMDKAIAAFKAVQERTRVTLPDGRKPFSVFTTTAQGYSGTYKILEDLKIAKQPYVKIRASTRDNLSLNSSYVDRLYSIYDENERLAYLEGYFVNLKSGRVYGDYEPSTCYVDDVEISDTDELMIGQDFNAGYSKGCVLVKKDKILYVVKNYSFPQIGHAPTIIRNDFPLNPITWFPDASAKEIMAGYSSEIRNAGIQVRIGASNPSIVERIFFVNKLFKMGFLKVCKKAKSMDTALRIRQFDDAGKPEKGSGELAPDHDCDSLEYPIYRIVSSDLDYLPLWQLSRSAWKATNITPIRAIV
jgi:hypothetical protein